ncbi:hypothetical protein C1H87_20415 [Flavivirga eckloniae]|uniref:Uncharacterized protein n=1 Tax=Flavivirga eckloniae TaxID=1803846 RepID=A0A2K9PV45_9FLAO|nr:hypothetical protein C1H87_20415 [Flavivirga eckloniae]
MAGLHGLSHSDDKEHADPCVICDHIITNNLIPTITSDSPYTPIESVELVVSRDLITSYSFLGETILSKAQLFSRPPPSLI